MSGRVEGDWIWGKESGGQEPQPFVPPFHWMPQKAADDASKERLKRPRSERYGLFIGRFFALFFFFFSPLLPFFFQGGSPPPPLPPPRGFSSSFRASLPQTRGARIALQTKRRITLVNIYIYVYIRMYTLLMRDLVFLYVDTFLFSRACLFFFFFFLCRLVLSDRIKDLICMMECIEVLLLCFR